MTVVWELDLPPGEKLVLLALADQANDEGTQCWPSVPTIARRSGQGDRTVRRALEHLEAKGHLTRQHRDGASTQYRVHPCQNGGPDNSAVLPKATETPAKLADKPPRTIIPKKSTTSRGKRATSYPEIFVPQMSGKTLTAVESWPPGKLDEQLEAFADHHTSHGTLSKDWQASWRTWVRNSKRFDRYDGRLAQRTAGTPGIGRTEQAALDVKARIRAAREFEAGGP